MPFKKFTKRGFHSMKKLQKTTLDGTILKVRVVLNKAKATVLNIESDDTYIKVACTAPFGVNILKLMQKELLHTNEIDIENIENLIFMRDGMLHIDYNWVYAFQNVYEAMTSFEKNPTSCVITEDTLFFKYSRRRYTMDFDQLMIIQDFINPGRVQTDNLFVIGMEKDYTVYVKFNEGRAA